MSDHACTLPEIPAEPTKDSIYTCPDCKSVYELVRDGYPGQPGESLRHWERIGG